MQYSAIFAQNHYIKIKHHTEIDRKKWDALVENTPNSLFMSAWYLDAVSPNWKAIVWGDYEAALPVNIVKKAGVEQVIQPIFTREFRILGQHKSLEDVLRFLQESYKNIDLRFDTTVKGFAFKERENQTLNLCEGFENNYSKNAKRLIKKADKLYVYKQIDDLSSFFDLIEQTLMPKIEEFNKHNIGILKQLMTNALNANSAECIGVFDSENTFVGAGFFFKHQKKIIYLKGAATDIAKKQGAMFGLINFALLRYVSQFSEFDFGGSDIINVADFYRKFGATNRIYYHYELNSLPFWYRWTKKILKKG